MVGDVGRAEGGYVPEQVFAGTGPQVALATLVRASVVGQALAAEQA